MALRRRDELVDRDPLVHHMRLLLGTQCHLELVTLHGSPTRCY